ncbi:MAG: hypothetical protein ABIO70_34605 [Pseudomonadota bacterium]
MQYRAATIADLKAPLFSAYHEALRDGAERFELLLAPGVFEGRDIALHELPQGSATSVVVRGEGPEPTILRNARLTMSAHDLTVQDLQIEGYSGDVEVVTLRARRSLRVSRVRFSDLSVSGEEAAGIPPVALSTLHGAQGAVFSLEDCWFSGNTVAASPGVLVQVDALTSRPLDELRLTRVSFVGNRAVALLHGGAIQRVTFAGVAAAEPEVEALWWSAHAPGTVALRDSALAFGGAGGWLKRTAYPPVPAERFALPEVEGSAILDPATLAPGALAALAAAAASSPQASPALAASISALAGE